jgi:hypothetical protein
VLSCKSEGEAVLTPLTNVTIELGRERDWFEFSSLRDSDSARVTVGLNFDRFALINGVAQFGYRLGRDLRIGFNVDQQKWISDIDLRQYDGRRSRMSVTYGL